MNTYKINCLKSHDKNNRCGYQSDLLFARCQGTPNDACPGTNLTTDCNTRQQHAHEYFYYLRLHHMC